MSSNQPIRKKSKFIVMDVSEYNKKYIDFFPLKEKL